MKSSFQRKDSPDSPGRFMIPIPSDLCSRRISAQSSTVITLHRVTQGVHFQPSIKGQFSPVVNNRLLKALLANVGWGAQTPGALRGRMNQ